ncbi:HalOD1 output domain-containing protein [Natrinema salinisoli]|uniref:HalOD1 output domain-containing protein n=1 Tax=Natrinema salinisoli TaxID=2878535 RepID=UPI001CEFF1C7|nr:HalOD1 output domain-containing protein [Natrinema salinisoli]
MSRDNSVDKPPSLAVVEAVAAKNGVDPTDLECRLADVIDPIALDKLFEPTSKHERRSGVVKFRFCERDVIVWADGNVEVK